jgi:tetratricopeptide (TPR) repeat protein
LSSDGHLQALLRHADALEVKEDNIQAVPVWQEILAIREQQLGPDRLSTAISLNNLAELYRVQGRYGEAETLFNRSLAIYGRVLGSDHPDTAARLNNLALLLRPGGTIRSSSWWRRRRSQPPGTSATVIGGGEPAGAGAVATELAGSYPPPGYLGRARSRGRGRPAPGKTRCSAAATGDPCQGGEATQGTLT